MKYEIIEGLKQLIIPFPERKVIYKKKNGDTYRIKNNSWGFMDNA